MQGSDKKSIGKVTWKSPSNIALVKYWGKYGRQYPKNTSISFTLQNAFTETTVKYALKSEKTEGVSIRFLFEGVNNKKFEEKIHQFLVSIIDYFPYLKDFHLDIESKNSFPHSTGIASSASSMSALALCLCEIEKRITGNLKDEKQFLEKSSIIARLGSGSACRSVFPHLALWGKLDAVQNSSNDFAIPISENIHPIFQSFRDSILIISSSEKSVSSRAGHALMEGNPYAKSRYQQANSHIELLINAMKNGNLDDWGKIVEKEALTLHALMMASEPPYILMHPNTLIAIERIQQFRKENQLPVFFTLDAGPNIHLLYPDNIKKEIISFIDEELVPLCENHRVIHDQVGKGPEKID